MSESTFPSELEWKALASLKPNDLMCCPFDRGHRLLRMRLQCHLQNKHPNHQPVVPIICPFNNSHRVSRQKFCSHLERCKSRVREQADFTKQSNPHRVQEDTSLPLPSSSTSVETQNKEDAENGHDYVLDRKMTSHSSKSDGKSPKSPVVQMSTNASIDDSLI